MRLGVHRWLRCFAGFVLSANFAVALAQEFPTRPVTIVVPTAPGGPLDLISRLLQPRLGPLLGQAVVVENRPGASTYVGGDYVAKSAPDGYTLLVNATSGLFPELFIAGLNTIQSRELTPVAPIGLAQFLFFTSAQVPANDLKEFVALVKANPDKYNIGVFSGAYSTLEMLNFVKSNGMRMLQVPYNSTSDIVTAMLRGDVHFYLGSISGAKAGIDSGRLRGLAVISAARSPVLPGVPTARELGFDIQITGDYDLFAPARTPQAVIALLNDRVTRALDGADARDKLASLGFEPLVEKPAAMAAKFARLSQDIHRVVKEAGITPK
jgi:tripartite-type tricarboxylate transporter receptor subunit TctC